MSIRDFANIIIEKFCSLESDLSEVYRMFIIFFTLPVTDATVERTFSKLKIIKDFKRNSIGQTRLKYLALIAIDNKEAS